MTLGSRPRSTTTHTPLAGEKIGFMETEAHVSALQEVSRSRRALAALKKLPS